MELLPSIGDEFKKYDEKKKNDRKAEEINQKLNEEYFSICQNYDER